jgi:hypothetical protein
MTINLELRCPLQTFPENFLDGFQGILKVREFRAEKVADSSALEP